MFENHTDAYAAVRDLINKEAFFLDRRRWDDWLTLYSEEAVFWVPSWASEEEPVSDPETSLNLMYLTSRNALSDRVFRLRTKDSLASVPLDRTTHVVGTIIVTHAARAEIEASANWVVHSFGRHGGFTRGGYYDYVLESSGPELRIKRKKITLLDDRLETAVDFYHL